MKTLLATFIVLASINANANLEDLAAISKSPSIQEIEESRDLGFLTSVNYYATAKCLGGPTIYNLIFQDGGKKCSLSVQVGTCGSTGKRVVEGHYQSSDAKCSVVEK